MTAWDKKRPRYLALLHSFFPPLFSPSPALSALLFSSHLISSEALRQDPVVDVVGDTGEGAVDDFRGAPLGDAVSDSFSVAAVGEREELPVHRSSHLRGKIKRELRFKREPT